MPVVSTAVKNHPSNLASLDWTARTQRSRSVWIRSSCMIPVSASSGSDPSENATQSSQRASWQGSGRKVATQQRYPSACCPLTCCLLTLPVAGSDNWSIDQSFSPPEAHMTARSLLTPITLRTAGERIAERIVTAIALGEFVPEQRLPTERELAAMLEVSRTTVREALQRLQASGYVTTRRGRGGGTFVTTRQGPAADEIIRRPLVPAWAELTEILDFRRLIEQLIARTAAQRRDDRDIAAI